jgi:hypothetical protein
MIQISLDQRVIIMNQIDWTKGKNGFIGLSHETSEPMRPLTSKKEWPLLKEMIGPFSVQPTKRAQNNDWTLFKGIRQYFLLSQTHEGQSAAASQGWQ